MSQELRKTGARRGSVWRAATALTGIAAMVGAMVALAPVASATGGGNNGYQGEKVTICHANNGSKGYTENTVSVNSVLKNSGHDSHSGDIIPPFDYQKWVKTKKHSGEWQDASYPGKNWDASGQEIWGNDCNPPATTVTVNKVWNINGQTVAGFPDGYDVQLQIGTWEWFFGHYWDYSNRDWGTSYTYNNEDKIKIDEKHVDVPQGCYFTGSNGTGEKNLSPGANTFTVTNNVTCVEDPTVTVNKVWQINGDTATAEQAAEAGLSATLTIASKNRKHSSYGNAEEKAWGTSYSYDKNTYLRIDEEVVNTGDCTIDNANSTQLPLDFKLKSDTTKTVTNAYNCPPPEEPVTTVTVVKQWVVNNGNPVDDNEQDDMTPGTLTVNGESATWGTPITLDEEELTWPTVVEGDEQGSGASTNLPGCEVNGTYGLTDEYELVSGQNNVITVTNYVTCRDSSYIALYKVWEGATGEPSTTLTINGGATDNSTAASTWSESLGSDPDFGNGASLSAFEGDPVTIAETAVAGYSASWACYDSMPTLRSPAGGAFVTAVPDYYGVPVSSGSGTSATFEMPSGYLSCFFTNTRQSTPPPPPPPPSVLPTSVTPAFTAECTLDGEDSLVTVTTTSVDGIVYEVTGNGTSAVTVTASAPSPSFTLVVPAGWAAGPGDSASIVVTDAGLTCVGGEQEEVDEEETTPEPETQPEPEVAGASEEVVQVQGAPSAAAKTGESSSNTWAYLVLAAGMLLLLGSARIRRSHGA